MLNRDDKWFLFYLSAGYLAFAEALSWETSKWPLCLVVSEDQSGDHSTSNQTCATVHEGVARGFLFLWNHTTHDNVLAFATVLIAVFTWTLWRSNTGLWRVTNESVNLARAEFLSSHRPRMRVKRIWLTHDTAWRIGGPFEVEIDVVNVGNTDGLITWINYETILLPPGQRLPQRPPYDEMPFGPDMRITRFRTNTTLPPGVTLAREVCDGIFDHQQVHDILWGHQRLFLIGTIEYHDRGGGMRQTGFCRTFTFNNYPPTVGDFGRFDIENDRNYEFEEWGN